MEMTTLDSMDYTKEVALCQLHRTIKYADVRCASSAEVIRRVLDTTDDDERSRSAALTLAARYPFEFAHAVGRTGDKALRVPLRELLHANSSDLEFLSIYAYALGKIGAKEELQSLKTSIPQAPDEM